MKNGGIISKIRDSILLRRALGILLRILMLVMIDVLVGLRLWIRTVAGRYVLRGWLLICGWNRALRGGLLNIGIGWCRFVAGVKRRVGRYGIGCGCRNRHEDAQNGQNGENGLKNGKDDGARFGQRSRDQNKSKVVNNGDEVGDEEDNHGEDEPGLGTGWEAGTSADRSQDEKSGGHNADDKVEEDVGGRQVP